jgi:hypothetical protein
MDETGKRNDQLTEQNVTVPHEASTATGEKKPNVPVQQPLPKSKTQLPPTRADMVQLDLNEPWQRSLLRQIEKLDKTELGKEAIKKPPYMMLGHTESRDFWLAFEPDADELSLETEASSIVPKRGQLVHRTNLNRRDSKHYRESDTFEQEGRDEVSSSNAVAKDRNKIPDKLPGRKTPIKYVMNNAGVNRHNYKKSNPYLEIDASADDDQNEIATVAPDNACFCIGYSVLDYLIAPPEHAQNGKRLGRHRSSLGRVPEERGLDPEGYTSEQHRRYVDL